MKCVLVKAITPLPSRVRCYALPPSHSIEAKQTLNDAINLAQSLCSQTAEEIECTIAWDNVDEIRRGVYLREEAAADPLEAFCVENEDADECRIYDL